MGENGKRLGRMSGYRQRGLAFLAGGGAIAVALVMMASPAAAASANWVMHPAFKGGVVSPDISTSESGCGKVISSVHPNLKLKTGIGGMQATGKASSCKKQVAGVGQDSNAQFYAEATVAIPLHSLKGKSTVAVGVAATYSVALSATDGVKGTAVPACTNNLYTYAYNSTEYEWNVSTGAFGYNDSYSDYDNGIYYNGSYAYGSAGPSPFVYTNNTYFYHDFDYGQDGNCYAESEGFAEVYGYLYDTSAGTDQYQSSNTLGNNGELFDTFTEVYNETDWECYADTEWDGYSSTWYNSTFACYSYNTTLTSEVVQYVPTYTTTAGASNSVSWTNSSSVAGTIDFNSTSAHFLPHDHYALVLYFYADMYASNSWAHGSAQFALNWATAGNGYRIGSITAT